MQVLFAQLRLDCAARIEPVAAACHDVRRTALNAHEDVVVIVGGPNGILVAMVARDAGGKVVISEVNPHRLATAQMLGFATVNPKDVDLVGAITTQIDLFQFFWRELDLLGAFAKATSGSDVE